MDAVMAEQNCSTKEYFNYVERGDKNCSCKKDKSTPLIIMNDWITDHYSINV